MPGTWTGGLALIQEAFRPQPQAEGQKRWIPVSPVSLIIRVT